MSDFPIAEESCPTVPQKRSHVRLSHSRGAMSDCPTAEESCPTVPQKRSHVRLSHSRGVMSDCPTAEESCPSVPQQRSHVRLSHSRGVMSDCPTAYLKLFSRFQQPIPCRRLSYETDSDSASHETRLQGLLTCS